jgi:hypothetical protein
MNRLVQVAHGDQTPASTAAVTRLHDLGRGVVVVYPTPGRCGEGIARDVLQALGKQFRDRTPRPAKARGWRGSGCAPNGSLSC